MKSFLLRLLGALLLLPLAAGAQQRATTRPLALPALLPVPADVQLSALRVPLRPLLYTVEGPSGHLVEQEGRRLLRTLPERYWRGLPAHPLTIGIRYQRLGTLDGNDLAQERYQLSISPVSILITADTHLGALQALRTLRQAMQTDNKQVYWLAGTIRDQPRFAWRGVLVDPARHFLPVPVIKRNLDGMAAVKLNVLHWHLSDDQGWRVESRWFPRLHTVGGATGYYTQAEVREVVRYASERGIRVVPEFDLPGHTGALVAAYPRLASNDSIKAVPVRWGVLNIAVDPTRETTYTFLDSLLTEMSGLFPDKYLHLGGDENDGRQWRHNPRIVEFMQEKCFLTDKGRVDKHQLQTYFNRRLLTTVQRLGKTMVGWDEVLGPDLPRPIVVESWRGPKGVAAATSLGHPALRANGYYIDLYLTAASHYTADPLQGVPDSLQGRVLGGEATMWSEFADSVLYDSRLWPRAAAVAERLWSPAALTQDVPDMYRRLEVVSAELEALGLQHRRAPATLLRQLAAPYPAALPALQTLASVIEPVKEYKRHFQGFRYTTETPLNRLVDAAPAEAEAARRFGATVDSLLAELPPTAAGVGAAPGITPTSATSDTAALRRLLPPALARPTLPPAALRHLQQLRQQVAGWQQATAALPPLFVVSASLAEYAPLAAQLGVVSEVVQQRLTQLEQGQPAPPGWPAAVKVQLDAAQKPAGQAELAVVAAVRRLAGL